MVSEKQKNILTKNGYTEQQISQMSYQQVSEAIGHLLARPKDVQANQAPYSKEVPAVQVERAVFTPRPAYNPSSQYVSYAKDVFLALRTMIHEEVAHTKMDVTDEQIMARSIQLVKMAIKEFG